jgi:hypothetical protein
MRLVAVLGRSPLPTPHQLTSLLEFGPLEKAGPEQHKPTRRSKQRAKRDAPAERAPVDVNKSAKKERKASHEEQAQAQRMPGQRYPFGKNERSNERRD